VFPQDVHVDERVGTAQRNQVIDLLGKALEGGYLELAEYENRMTAATAARRADELVAQTADLPGEFQWVPRQRLAPTVRPVDDATTDRNTRMTGTVSLVLAILSFPLGVCYGIGAIFGLAAIALSRPGLKSRTNYGISMAGLVLGCAGVLFSLAMLVIILTVLESGPTVS
jgi:hypothetical protein